MNDECNSLTSSTDVPAASTNSVILEMNVVQPSDDHGNLTDVGVVIMKTPVETSGTTGRENTTV